MKLVRPAPGRPLAGRPGALLLLAVAFGWACEGIGTGRQLELDGETVELPLGADVHDVRFRVERGDVRVQPDTVRAEEGDVIRFIAGDGRGYAVMFDPTPLSGPARRFLERTGQLRGPPLIQKDASWIVDLTDAPAGAYPFTCLGRNARGTLLVTGS